MQLLEKKNFLKMQGLSWVLNDAANLEIVRRKPATNAFILQIGMQVVGKFLILRRIADEAAVELYGLVCERWQIVDQGIRKPAEQKA